MKLIECYVNNFGKLSDFSYSFKDGLNVIEEENGFGKSTLSAFIKSMLFGLEDTKKAGLFENDRKKYEPWQGGAWGGSLTISSGGEEYRIERSFFKKASLDEIKVYELKTGKLCEKFSEKSPGEILLGIDRDGFERTVFLSEREIDEKKSINNISAKLSRLTGVAFDMAELDSATKLLEAERQYYYKKGGSGAISDINERISELEYRKSELLLLDAKHEADAKSILQKEAEIKELRQLAEKELEEEKKSALREDRFLEYKTKLSEMRELKTRADEILRFFGGKLPEKETLYELASLKEEISRLNASILNVEREIDSLPPSPSEKEIEKTTHLALKIKENEKKYEKLEDEKLNTGAVKAQKIKIFMILGAALILLGIPFAFINPALLAISAIGAFLLITGLLFSKNASKQKSDTELDDLRLEIENDKISLSEFYASYGLVGCGTDFATAEFKERARKKEALLITLRDKRERLDKAREKCGEIAKTYPVTNEYPSIELNAKIDMYKYTASNLERLTVECKKLEENFNFSERDEIKAEAKPRISDTLIAKERELSLLKNAFSFDENALLELDEINSSLELLRESEAAARYKYEIIKKTKSFLEAAKDSLTSKYLGKTREAFSKYVNTVSESLGEYGVDTSFAITKTEGGATRIKDAFSKGTQKLYDFAMRLSFADSLYEGELPFLMLDDPFAYFDDAKLCAALALLHKLSEERQIIYFTAAKSRT